MPFGWMPILIGTLMYDDWRTGGLSEFGARGKKYIVDECGYEKLCKAFVDWAGDASRAPIGVSLSGGRLSAGLSGGLQYLRDNGMRKFLKKVRSKILSYVKNRRVVHTFFKKIF